MKRTALIVVIIAAAILLNRWFAGPTYDGPRLSTTGRDARIAEYFAEAHGDDPVTYRLNEPLFERAVSAKERQTIIARDDYKCVICGSRDELEVCLLYTSPSPRDS